MWQLFHPFSLYVIKPFFELTHYNLIDSLALSILLWISRGGVPIRNAQVITIPFEGFAIKLKTIIRDENMRDSKLSDNIFPEKSLCIHVPDICQWFSFNSFGEIIHADQQPSFIPRCLRERSYNFQAPLSKRLRTG